jgi:diguanylate cyclase (GGDEF)-like protein
LGANDYITKPVDFAVALARVNAQLTRRRQEVTRQSTDALTGLPNRAAVINMAMDCAAARRPAAVFSLNVDRFRAINNGLGRACGDTLLVEIAGLLERIVPQNALVGRLQADEFACVLLDTTRTDAAAFATRALEELRRPFAVGGHRLALAVSGGLACGPSGRALDQLLDQADTALYRAKTLSGDRWEMFAPALHSRAASRLQLELALQDAVAQSAFELRYEPIVDLATARIMGFEALARWPHPERGEIPPLQFIPIAEETRLIVPLGQLVFRLACEQLAAWQKLGIEGGAFSVNVNVSARQLDNPDCVEEFHRALDAQGLDPRSITLEITESALMEDSARTRVVLDRLHAIGFQLALDDFGTGYSSLSYLQQFPVNAIKIDRSFIARLDRPEGIQIASAIMQLAQTLGLDVVGEGIESVRQMTQLQELGCKYGQGYFFTQPLTAQDAITALRNGLPALSKRTSGRTA